MQGAAESCPMNLKGVCGLACHARYSRERIGSNLCICMGHSNTDMHRAGVLLCMCGTIQFRHISWLPRGPPPKQLRQRGVADSMLWGDFLKCLLFSEISTRRNKCSVKFMSQRNCISRGLGTSTRWAHSLLSKKLMKENGLKSTLTQFSNNGIRLQKNKLRKTEQFCFRQIHFSVW